MHWQRRIAAILIGSLGVVASVLAENSGLSPITIMLTLGGTGEVT
jgi:hypothetical protein